jgi:hypothetical protein
MLNIKFTNHPLRSKIMNLHSYFLFVVMFLLWIQPLFASEDQDLFIQEEHIPILQHCISDFDDSDCNQKILEQTQNELEHLYDHVPQEKSETVMYSLNSKFNTIFRGNGRNHFNDFLRLNLSKFRQTFAQNDELANLIIVWKKIGLDIPTVVEDKILSKSQFIVSPAEAPPKVEA